MTGALKTITDEGQCCDTRSEERYEEITELGKRSVAEILKVEGIYKLIQTNIEKLKLSIGYSCVRSNINFLSFLLCLTHLHALDRPDSPGGPGVTATKLTLLVAPERQHHTGLQSEYIEFTLLTIHYR